MATIILARNNKILQKIELYKERITIGRALHNDLVIDNRAISAEHAVIVTINKDSFLEDLNSTNGTQVNGQPIKKHFLQENDLIELAQYKIQYFGTDNCGELSNESNLVKKDSVDENRSTLPSIDAIAFIRVLNGINAGKEFPLTKVLTTLGRAGEQIAVVTRQPKSYFLAHLQGEDCPLINGFPIGDGPHKITHGDVIDLAGTQMKFLLG